MPNGCKDFEQRADRLSDGEADGSKHINSKNSGVPAAGVMRTSSAESSAIEKVTESKSLLFGKLLAAIASLKGYWGDRDHSRPGT